MKGDYQIAGHRMFGSEVSFFLKRWAGIKEKLYLIIYETKNGNLEVLCLVLSYVNKGAPVTLT